MSCVSLLVLTFHMLPNFVWLMPPIFVWLSTSQVELIITEVTFYVSLLESKEPSFPLVWASRWLIAKECAVPRSWNWRSARQVTFEQLKLQSIGQANWLLLRVDYQHALINSGIYHNVALLSVQHISWTFEGFIYCSIYISFALNLCNLQWRKYASASLEYTPSDILLVDSRSIPFLLGAYLALFPQLRFVTEKQPGLSLNNWFQCLRGR